jgi:hypothetical protein
VIELAFVIGLALLAFIVPDLTNGSCPEGYARVNRGPFPVGAPEVVWEAYRRSEPDIHTDDGTFCNKR